MVKEFLFLDEEFNPESLLVEAFLALRREDGGIVDHREFMIYTSGLALPLLRPTQEEAARLIQLRQY